MSISKPFCTLLSLVASVALANAQAPDPNVIARIRDEGMNHSQVMSTMSYLCDVIGQRLTGSPSLKRANEWTRDKMQSWGLQNAHLEAWGPFGRGWELERFSCQVSSPMDIPLIAYPKAWSPSIHANAEVVLVDAADQKALEAYRGKLRGKIVMIGGARPIPARFTAQGSRYTDKELQAMAHPEDAVTTPAAPTANLSPEERRRRTEARRAQFAMGGIRLKFAMDEGAVAVLDGSRGDDGTLFVQSASLPAASLIPAPVTAGQTAPPVPQRRVWDKDAPKTIPQVTVSSEQYNRMARMIQQGAKLKVDLDLSARFYDKDLMAYNTVAEIPGSDLKDQVVMVGGHMDSWHAGTGATDNGAGVVVAMEAARILKTLNLQPRRTIELPSGAGKKRACSARERTSLPTSGPCLLIPPAALAVDEDRLI